MPRSPVLIVLGLALLAVIWFSIPGDDEPPTKAPDAPLEEPPAASAPALVGRSHGDGLREALDASVNAFESNATAPTHSTHYLGTVLGPDGKPVPNASIFEWKKTRIVDTAVRSDPEGRFALSLTKGRVRVYVRATGLWPVDAAVSLYRGRHATIELAPAYPVHVTVTDLGAAVPLEGAVVRSSCGDEQANEPGWPVRHTDIATTDAQGRATVMATRGSTKLVVSKTGYATRKSKEILVTPKGADVTIGIGRGGSISGRIVDPDGQPVAGAKIHGVSEPRFSAYATTDAQGRFRFDEVPTLADAKSSVDHSRSAVLSVRTKAWAPQAWRVEHPERGQTVETEFQVRPPRVVRGRALREDGTPASGIHVVLEPKDWTWFAAERLFAPAAETTTDQTGHFVLQPVAPGKSEIRAYWPNRGGFFDEIECVVAGEGPDTEVVLNEHVAGKRRTDVRVLDADGNPLDDVRVEAQQPGSDDHIASERTNEHGWARFARLPAAPIELSVRPDGHFERRQPVDLTHRDGGDVVIRLPAGEITGVVTTLDGTPTPAEILAEYTPADADEDAPWRPQYVKTGTDGRFRIRGLVPGRVYEVSDFMHDTLLAGPLRFRAGDKLRWVIGTREQAERLRPVVRLLSTAGDEIEEAWIRVDENSEEAAGFTPAGKALYWAPYAALRKATLYVHTEDYRLVVLRDVALKPGPQPTELRIPLDRGATLRGRVVDEDGERVEGYIVEVGGREYFDHEGGAFEVRGLADGATIVRVRGGLFHPTEKEVVVSASRPTDVVIRVRAAGALVIVTKAKVDDEPQVELRREVDEEVVKGEIIRAFGMNGGVRGVAQMGSLVPGRYVIAVVWKGQRHDLGDVEVVAGEVKRIEFIPK